ncbi:MAG TPA: hypothetical protein VMC79_12205 [Rectinemataceae bacterium]|nr:hypothetical protein [Rectinemataceae bacterium]
MRFLHRSLQGDDLREEAPPPRLYHSSFRLGQPREVQSLDLFDGGLDLVEPRAQPGGRGAQGRGALVARPGLGTARIPEEVLTGRSIRSQAVGDEEGQGLAGGEAVAARGVGQLDLARAIVFAEGHCDRQGETAGVQADLQLRGEIPFEEKTTRHPGLLPAEELRDGRGAQVVVVDQRGDHPCFVHGARGPSRAVGIEEPGLQGDAARCLDHHRDFALALPGPPRETLESVDDLEVSVARVRHPQRKRRQVHLAVRATSPERREAHAETGDRDQLDQGHRRTSTKGRIW